MSGVKIIAPASLTLFGMGYSGIGIAIDDLHDEILVKLTEKPGVHIASITGFKEKKNSNRPDSTLRAATYTLEKIKELGLCDANLGVELSIRKRIPTKVGLGASMSAAAGAVLAVHEMAKAGCEKKLLLQWLTESFSQAGETVKYAHAAATMFGGIQLMTNTQETARLYSPKGLHLVIAAPNDPQERLFSKESYIYQSIKNEKLSVMEAANLASHAALMVAALGQTDFGMLKTALRNAELTASFTGKWWGHKSIVSACEEAGALGCVTTGTGPSHVAFCKNTLEAEQCEQAMRKAYLDNGIEATFYNTKVSLEGCTRL